MLIVFSFWMITFHLQRTAQASARIAGLASHAPVVSPVLVELLDSVTIAGGLNFLGRRVFVNIITVTIAATATTALIVLGARTAPLSKKTRVQRRVSWISGVSGERGESAVKLARGVGLDLAAMNL